MQEQRQLWGVPSQCGPKFTKLLCRAFVGPRVTANPTMPVVVNAFELSDRQIHSILCEPITINSDGIVKKYEHIVNSTPSLFLKQSDEDFLLLGS